MTNFTVVKNLPVRTLIPKICAQKQDQLLNLVQAVGFRRKKSFKNLIEPFLRKVDLKIGTLTHGIEIEHRPSSFALITA